MNSLKERLAFSERLQQALISAGYSPSSPTQLAREFNQRFSDQSVTVHAARKWLHGESIPTQNKLRSLAGWLDVPAEWLRFGDERTGEGRPRNWEATSHGEAAASGQLTAAHQKQ